MNRKNNIFIMIILLISLSLIACDDMDDKINKIVEDTEEIVKDNLGEITDNKTISKEEIIEISDDIIDSLDINIDIGDINIYRYDGDKINFKITKSINKKFGEEGFKKIIIEDDIKNNIYSLNIKYDNRDMQNKNYSTDLDIEIPGDMDLEKINIYCNIGDIDIKDIEGEFSIETDVGDIEGEEIILKRNSIFKSDVGDIELDIEEFMDIKTIDLDTDVGDVELNIRSENIEGLEYIKINTDVGDIDFNMDKEFNNIIINKRVGDIESNQAYSNR